MNDLQFAINNASFSPDRKYRYALWRIWDNLPKIMFVGLNPSTANETMNDPTIRRCISFAKDWGYGGIYMCNLFAYISTDPKAVIAQPDPIGPDNDRVLKLINKNCKVTVAAWGAFSIAHQRSKEVFELLPPLMCLGITKNGYPKHPLYLSKNTQLQEYRL